MNEYKGQLAGFTDQMKQMQELLARQGEELQVVQMGKQLNAVDQEGHYRQQAPQCKPDMMDYREGQNEFILDGDSDDSMQEKVVYDESSNMSTNSEADDDEVEEIVGLEPGKRTILLT